MEPPPRSPQRWLALAALAAAVLVVPTASAGSAASIKGVGAGETSAGLTEFELSAHAENDPTTPENGFGQVKIKRATGTFTIDVRCTRVAILFGPPAADITGVVIRSSDPAVTPGAPWLVLAADGGEPGSAGPVDSFAESGLFNGDVNNFCMAGQVGVGTPNVTQGNIVVKG
jgi:hypothetical protein